MERQKKTAEQRALEALGTAERVEKRANLKVKEAEEALVALRNTQAQAKARRIYVAQHPDLPEDVRAATVPEPEPEPATAGRPIPDSPQG